jgi:hypothetical protein
VADELHQNNIGAEFRLVVQDDGVAVDLSECLDPVIIILKPSGSRLEKAANLYTDGTDGILYYNCIDGDLDEVGLYKIQACVDIDDGVFYSSVASFKVHKNI